MGKVYKFSSKENLRFETELEKEIHSWLSKLCYGEIKYYDFDGTDEEKRNEVIKAFKKSAYYNNMDVQLRWKPDFQSLRVTHEM